MALSLKGNTLILYQFVEKHGKILNTLFDGKNRNVTLVHGEVDSLVREEVRQLAEINNDMIIVASYGTFSTGVNIKKLHNTSTKLPCK